MVLASGERVLADAVVLAAGHSARELYQELLRCGATLAPKDFAVGFRIEHPQGEYLPISPHISSTRKASLQLFSVNKELSHLVNKELSNLVLRFSRSTDY